MRIHGNEVVFAERKSIVVPIFFSPRIVIHSWGSTRFLNFGARFLIRIFHFSGHGLNIEVLQKKEINQWLHGSCQFRAAILFSLGNEQLLKCIYQFGATPFWDLIYALARNIKGHEQLKKILTELVQMLVEGGDGT